MQYQHCKPTSKLHGGEYEEDHMASNIMQLCSMGSCTAGGCHPSKTGNGCNEPHTAQELRREMQVIGLKVKHRSL